MKTHFTKIATCFMLLATAFGEIATAQNADSVAAELRRNGNLWGLTFGDYFFKNTADTAGSGLGRGNNQYSKLPATSRMFQFRRVYLGYNYNISPKVAAEVLFAVEDDFNPGSVGNQSSNGDALADGKFAPYLKAANVRWKGVFKGSDIVFGEMNTPAFPMLSENIWGYRSIERTIADMRRTPSVDKGVALQGKLYSDSSIDVGYNFMIGNGNGSKPEIDNFQMFYGDVWVKLFNKKLIIDLYQDYGKLDWNRVDTLTHDFHHDRNMTKLMVAYQAPKFTVGIEAFQTTLMGDVEASSLSNRTYYYTTYATAVSIFGRGRLYKNKLGFFARYDNYDPGHRITDITGTSKVISYVALTPSFDPTTKEQFVTFGVDYTPFPNFHLMPNFYMNTYKCTLPEQFYGLNPKGSPALGTDALFRVTVYYIFGKKDAVQY
jgi:hypothetical protein